MRIILVLFTLFFSILGISQNREREAEKHFSILLNKQGDELLNAVLIHQPTLADCKVMFKKKYYKQFYENFSKMYVGFSEKEDYFDNLVYKAECKVSLFNSSKLDELPGKVRNLAQYFTPNINCYEIILKDNKEDKYGESLYFATYMNNRWILFLIN